MGTDATDVPTGRVPGSLYAVVGVLGLLALAVLVFEVVSPWLVEKAYNRELIPAINQLISNRSYPVWHFERVARVLFYNTFVYFLFGGTVIFTLVVLRYQRPQLVKKRVAPVTSFFTGLPRTYQWTLVGAVLLLLTVQFVDRNRLTFPFASWKVYGKSYMPNKITYHTFRGQAACGDPVPINPEVLWYSVEGSIYHVLEKRGEAVNEETPTAEPQVYDKILRAIGSYYAQTRKAEIERLEVVKHTRSPIQADTSWHRTEVIRRVDIHGTPEVTTTQ